ncbi:MAG: EamA family transporter, partial [Fibrobacterota bacterium]
MVPAFFACFLWSTAFVGIKTGSAFTDNILSFAGLRFTLAGLLLAPFAFRHTSPVRAFRTHYQLILAVAASQVFLLYLFFYLGIERIPASLAAVFVGFSPMAASLVA